MALIASILADLAVGRLAATHNALDGHPRWRAGDYLRQMLIAGGVLPPGDENWPAPKLAWHPLHRHDQHHP